MGYQDIFHFDDPVGPLECIFMALLALCNEGAPGHFFHLMEVPTTRLPNVKMLLRWPSRMQILEQFDVTIEWKVTERSEGVSYALKPY